jgi:hypothetical protein
MPETAQLNVLVPSDVDATLEGLAERYGWSKREAAATAIRSLEALMKAHEACAEQRSEDVRELWMRIAQEMPAAFVEIPRDGVETGHVGDQAAVQLDNWLITDVDGTLMAQEIDGAQRLAKIEDGEIKPLRIPNRGLN